MKKDISFLVLFIFFFLSIELSAQWQQTNGPGKGYIYSFTSNDSCLFAGTDGNGVFVSKDNGESWQPANNGIKGLTISSLIYSDNYLFASANEESYTGTVYISSDNGKNWDTSGSGLPNAYISSLAVSDSNIFAGTQGNGVYLSTNNGKSWNQVNDNLDNPYIIDFSVDKSGIYVFSNAGPSQFDLINKKWNRIPFTISNFAQRFTVYDSVVYIAAAQSVYSTTDKGLNWHLEYNNIPSTVSYTITAVLKKNSALFAGTDMGEIFRLTDDSQGWELVNEAMGYNSILNFSAADSNLFAGTFGGGLFVSSDDGKSWESKSKGIINTNVTSIALIDSVIFASTKHMGLFRSTDKGEIWIQPGGSLNDTDFTSLAAYNEYIFAGTMGHGILRSNDYGKNWESFSGTGPYIFTESILVIDTTIFAGCFGKIYKSSTNVYNWEKSSTGIPADEVKSLVSNDSILFAGTWGDGVYRSTDMGDNWNESNEGLINKFIVSLYIIEDTLFARANHSDIYFSIDWGSSWENLSNYSEVSNFSSVVVGKEDMYAATSGSGVLRKPVSIKTSVKVISKNIPDGFYLSQNYPNPFNPSTIIKYQLPVNSMVNLTVYNLLGQEVATLVNQQQAPGNYEVKFDAGNFASGIYLYKITAGSYTATKKLLLLK